jgi:hypothetical protein
MSNAEERQEFLCISVDATLRCCNPLMGQASYRAPRGVRQDMPFPDEQSVRRVLTVRGRTGRPRCACALRMHTML